MIDDVLNRSNQIKNEDDYDTGKNVKWDQNSEDYDQNNFDWIHN